jgi:hypothetical protein
MLIRISLIVAILAGLAVGGLNFVKVKEKITTLQTDLKREADAHKDFEGKYNTTRKELAKTTADLKQTKDLLQATTEAKDKAETDLAAQTTRANKLTDDLAKTRQERDDSLAALAAYKSTGYTAQQVLGMGAQYKKVQDNLQVAEDENRILLQRIKKLDNELARYVTPEKPVYLPPSLKGKVLVTDPKWNFVVLNVGENQGVLEYGELLVNRNGRLVAKVVVRSVQKDRSIANVLPGWELGSVMEGDQVIPAHPAS